MRKFLAILAMLSLSLSAEAQDFTVRFDWIGVSNLFRATFTVTEQDFNSRFQSDLFVSSMDVTTPLGRHYKQGGSVQVGSALGQWTPWGLSFIMNDSSDGSTLSIYGVGTSSFSDWSIIHLFNGAQGWEEEGHWAVIQQVPEPSLAALAMLSSGVFLAWRRRR
jgi:hypothetical protein